MTLLDTSVIIDYLLGDRKIVPIVQELAKSGDVKTTTITEYELLRHKDRIKKQAAQRFLSGAAIYSFDSRAAQKAALLFEELQDIGRIVNETDLFIAGITLANDEVLLTRDQKLGSIGKENIKIV